MENPAEVLPDAELLVKIMVIGLTCRAVSDGWMKLFYGAGHIRKYAPYVFAGGLFNPILSVLLILVLPKTIDFTGPAIAYSAVFFFVHLIIMPQVTAKSVGLNLRKIIRPSIRPFTLAVVASPALLVAKCFSETEFINWAGASVGVCCYAIVYALVSWCFLLSKQERCGIQRLVFQRFKR